MDTLEVVVGIVTVGRVLIDFSDLQRSTRGRLLFAADCRRIEPDQRVRFVEQFYGLPGLVDLDPGGFAVGLLAARVDDDDAVAGMVETLSGAEGPEQIL